MHMHECVHLDPSYSAHGNCLWNQSSSVESKPMLHVRKLRQLSHEAALQFWGRLTLPCLPVPMVWLHDSC
jgi:hypothetical protein